MGRRREWQRGVEGRGKTEEKVERRKEYKEYRRVDFKKGEMMIK